MKIYPILCTTGASKVENFTTENCKNRLNWPKTAFGRYHGNSEFVRNFLPPVLYWGIAQSYMTILGKSIYRH